MNNTSLESGSKETIMALEWSSKLETNISEIDSQHKRLFFLINEMEALISNNQGKLTTKIKEIKESVSALEQYTLSHFLIEERVMEDNDYPDIENHKLLHNKFTDKITTVKEELLHGDLLKDEANLEIYLQGILKYLTTWLTNHIMVKDMEYKPFIRHTL